MLEPAGNANKRLHKEPARPSPAPETDHAMPGPLIVVDSLADWRPYYPTENVISVRDYLSRPFEEGKTVHLINLSNSYRYLSKGYYCSLLAEARGHKVIPSIKTINDLSRRSLYSLDIRDLDKLLEKVWEDHPSEESSSHYVENIYFGVAQHQEFQDLGRQLFDLFPCPLLQVHFKKQQRWFIESLKSLPLDELSDSDQDQFANALDNFSRKIWRAPRSRRQYRYDLAILHNPQEVMPPSNRTALKEFVRVGRKLGMDVELIEKKDFNRLAEYDALFIRETTAVNHHTYTFAKKAAREGMVVVDDATSILRCTNKVYLADLAHQHELAAPRTEILYKDSPNNIELLEASLGYPIVIKIPDGSFSRGVVKATTREELQQALSELFARSFVLLAQEFLYTDFDWRIGVLDKQPLFACQYFMSRGHWQIYKHDGGGQVKSGAFKTMPIREVPREVVKLATKAASFFGEGLYGVDIKQAGDRLALIEVNDNPNVDAGVEDVYLGDDLYRRIMSFFLERLERRRLGG